MDYEWDPLFEELCSLFIALLENLVGNLALDSVELDGVKNREEKKNWKNENTEA